MLKKIGLVILVLSFVFVMGTGSANATTTIAVNAITESGALTIDSAGVLELNSSAGIIGIGNDAVAQNINVGTGAAARVVTIGNTTAATAVNINTGTAGSTITTTGAGDFVVASADTVLIDSAGVLELNSSAGVIGIGNDAVAQNINVGTGAAARVVTIGNTTAATAVNINAGTGASTFAVTGAGTLALGGAAATGAVKLAESTGIQSISIGTVPAAETTAKTIIIGNANATSTSTTTIHAGTGGLNLATTADARTINLGTGNAIQTIKIGDNATPVNVITIGGTASTLGFYGVTPVVRPSAYTQTYATADKTHADSTATTITAAVPAAAPAGGVGTAAGGWDTGANRDLAIATINDLRTHAIEMDQDYEALLVDVIDLKQLVNSLIDDQQALGLVQ